MSEKFDALQELKELYKEAKKVGEFVVALDILLQIRAWESDSSAS